MKGAYVKPRVFVGSSSEGCAIANAVCSQLKRETEPTLWSRDVFLPSDYPLETLEEQITSHSFAVLVASPDDALIKRGKLYPAMRDNLLLEFGLFVGALGRRHAFFICPSTPKVELPSDLLGVITATYKLARMPNKIADRDGALRQAVQPACRQILKVIKKEWVLMRYRKAEEVRGLQQSEKVRAAKKIYAVASRLFTKPQREAFTSWSDAKAFKKMKASAEREINAIAQSLTTEAKLLGLERHVEQLKAATKHAIRDFPYVSMAGFEKKAKEMEMKVTTQIERDPHIARLQDKLMEMRMKIAMQRVQDGGAAERDIPDAIIHEMNALEGDIRDAMMKKANEERDALSQELKGLLDSVAGQYERWWNKHWPRLAVC
jgi:hypothetical protein